MDCLNNGEEIAEEQVEKNKLCLIDGHAGRKDRKGGRTRMEGGHDEGRKCYKLYNLSLLPLGTFLATWLYTVRKTPDTRAEKR